MYVVYICNSILYLSSCMCCMYRCVLYLYSCMCVVCIVIYISCMYVCILGEHLVQAIPFVPPFLCDKIDNYTTKY